jgi:hypothetical protein
MAVSCGWSWLRCKKKTEALHEPSTSGPGASSLVANACSGTQVDGRRQASAGGRRLRASRAPPRVAVVPSNLQRVHAGPVAPHRLSVVGYTGPARGVSVPAVHRARSNDGEGPGPRHALERAKGLPGRVAARNCYRATRRPQAALPQHRWVGMPNPICCLPFLPLGGEK